ncbi:hypothetical protein Hanom_Chr07g00612541 [Helianthus anomalus]
MDTKNTQPIRTMMKIKVKKNCFFKLILILFFPFGKGFFFFFSIESLCIHTYI